jgi:hypothetical protein
VYDAVETARVIDEEGVGEENPAKVPEALVRQLWTFLIAVALLVASALAASAGSLGDSDRLGGRLAPLAPSACGIGKAIVTGSGGDEAEGSDGPVPSCASLLAIPSALQASYDVPRVPAPRPTGRTGVDRWCRAHATATADP